jgi:hypothetical protein
MAGDAVSRAAPLRSGGVAVVLLVLAVLAGALSPGFPAPGADGHGRPGSPRFNGGRPAEALDGAGSPVSSAALADIPGRYLTLYRAAARTCPALAWTVLAGIGKVESDHGRSTAPGVKQGLNRAGCCAGPMQFNLTNGPPSTWASFGRGDVYDPADAIPAAARKLCADGLARPPPRVDPCPHVRGSAALHVALKRYNNACWYVHAVLTVAGRYTAGPAAAPAEDPFVRALLRNPRLTTTRQRGCDPRPDLAAGRLDLRVPSLLAVLVNHYRIRVSCVHTGHSPYVRGTRRISNHTVWRAVDVDQVDGRPVGPGNAAARALVAWLDRLEGPLRPTEIGSPFDLGRRPYFSDEHHRRHIHVGFGPWTVVG